MKKKILVCIIAIIMAGCCTPTGDPTKGGYWCWSEKEWNNRKEAKEKEREDLEAEKRKAERRRKELEEQRNALQAELNQLNGKLNALNRELDEKEKEILKIGGDTRTKIRQIEHYQTKSDALKQEIEKIRSNPGLPVKEKEERIKSLKEQINGLFIIIRNL